MLTFSGRLIALGLVLHLYFIMMCGFRVSGRRCLWSAWRLRRRSGVRNGVMLRGECVEAPGFRHGDCLEHPTESLEYVLHKDLQSWNSKISVFRATAAMS